MYNTILDIRNIGDNNDKYRSIHTEHKRLLVENVPTDLVLNNLPVLTMLDPNFQKRYHFPRYTCRESVIYPLNTVEKTIVLAGLDESMIPRALKEKNVFFTVSIDNSLELSKIQGEDASTTTNLREQFQKRIINMLFCMKRFFNLPLVYASFRGNYIYFTVMHGKKDQQNVYLSSTISYILYVIRTGELLSMYTNFFDMHKKRRNLHTTELQALIRDTYNIVKGILPDHSDAVKYTLYGYYWLQKINEPLAMFVPKTFTGPISRVQYSQYPFPQLFFKTFIDKESLLNQGTTESHILVLKIFGLSR